MPNFKDRKSKLLDKSGHKFFLNLTPDSIDRKFIIQTLIPNSEGEPPYNTWDLLKITKDELLKYKNPLAQHKNIKEMGEFETTVGCYILHLFLYEGFRQHIEYINKDHDSKVCGSIDDRMVFLLLDNKITVEDYDKFIDKSQWLGLGMSKYFVPSFDVNSLITRPEIKKLKEQKIAENQEMFETGDAATASKVRDELIAEAKKIMENEKFTGYELFQSGVAKFGNHYANVSIMRGALPKSSSKNTEFNILTNALNEGIPKSEIAPMADLMVLASFSRAVNTRIGGYLAKKFIAAFQHLKLDEPGSDCGTKFYTNVYLDEKNIRDYHLSYIRPENAKANSKWILLDGDKFPEYTGKRVQVRTPRYCASKDICSKCAGELYYRMEIDNIGLLTGRVASKILNASLKFFHDVSTKYSDINVNEGLIPTKPFKPVTKKDDTKK